jgi:hypothetical protein
VVWQIVTDISEECAASTFGANEKAKREQSIRGTHINSVITLLAMPLKAIKGNEMPKSQRTHLKTVAPH